LKKINSTRRPKLEPLELAKKVVEILDELKAENIVLLDVSGMTPMCDYFVVATIISPLQSQAIVDRLEQFGKKQKVPRNFEGGASSRWILVDLGDLIVHLFGKEERIYYNLEELWKRKS